MQAILTPVDSLVTPSTSPTQQTKRTECCVLGTPTTPEPRYLILSTSPVLTTGDTSSTTTTELILRIPRGIQNTPTANFAKWKSMVRIVFCFIYKSVSNLCYAIIKTQYACTTKSPKVWKFLAVFCECFIPF